MPESTETHSADATRQMGRVLARQLRGGDVVLLRGSLGAGKSVLARGIGEELGATPWRGSPTFNLIHEYDTHPRLYHVDLYRLAGEEVEDLHLEEAISEGGILVVEWPERASGLWAEIATARTINVELQILGPEDRLVTGATVSQESGAT